MKAVELSLDQVQRLAEANPRRWGPLLLTLSRDAARTVRVTGPVTPEELALVWCQAKHPQ